MKPAGFTLKSLHADKEVIPNLRQQLSAALLWKEAVEHELIVAGIWRKSHENDPKSAVKEAIDWYVQVARNPQLEGKIEAKPGDLVALAVSEYDGMLHQPEVSKRPCLSADGKSAVFDWKEGEGGPFMVSLEE